MDTLYRVPRTGAGRSLATDMLIDRLRQMAIGEFVPYADLNTLIGGNIQRENHLLISARRFLLREEQMVFEVRPNAGVVRLSEAEKLPAGKKRLQEAGRKVIHGGKILAAANPLQLSPSQQLQQLGLLSLAQAAMLSLADKPLQEGHAATAQPLVPLLQYQRLFAGL